ncbi:MAG: MFS transporter [Fimbriimonas sp.]|nr:MFS transporter [Fimbriimonas sp.]
MPTIDDPILAEDMEIPHAPSPYLGKVLRAGDHLKISAYWFATNFLWGALLVIMLPGEIKKMVPYDRITAIGLLTGLGAFAALVVPLVVGALSDRCASPWGRRRPYITFGVGVNVIGLGLMCAAFVFSKPLPPSGSHNYWGTVFFFLQNPTFLLYTFAYLVVQLGNNIASAAYSGVIPDLVEHEYRGLASGYMALMTQLGTLFGAVGCGKLLEGQPETLKYAVLAIALVGVALVTILGIKETPLETRPPKIHWPTYASSLWIDPKKYPDFAWVWITRALVMLGFYSVLPFINYYFVDVIGIEKPDGPASELIGLLLIASSVSGIYGGVLSDRIGRKKVVYIANVMIAAISLSFIFCRSIPQVLVAGIIFGLGFGAYTSVDWALGTDVLPSKKHAGKEMAVWHIAMTLPQAIAAPFAGELISRFGKTVTHGAEGDIIHYTIPGYSAVFILCAVCFALGAFLLKNVRSVR